MFIIYRKTNLLCYPLLTLKLALFFNKKALKSDKCQTIIRSNTQVVRQAVSFGFPISLVIISKDTIAERKTNT